MSVKTLFATILLAALAGATPMTKRGPTHHGDATFYSPDGAFGACGGQSSSNDLVVALNPSAYNGGRNCGRRLGISFQGKYVEATAVDLCPGCARYGLDLSPAAFNSLASPDLGRIQVDWHFL
ncbi:RlpA-like double-psi beta-barrel-protein domain-containing protein-containing protein [Trametes elegans]|nr:RlpA-like double-psi beta-barrel-protein domain-containing protein-containing protein [Trametes elegans]